MKILPIVLSIVLVAVSSCSTSVLTKLTANDQREQIQKIPRAEWHYAKSARSKIRKASQIYPFQPEKATVLYLSAARELEPYKDKAPWAYRAYDQALGMAVELIHEHNYWGKTLQYKDAQFTVETSTNGIPACELASIKLASKYNSHTLHPSIIRRGRGVAMVANYAWSKEREKENPFIPFIGLNFSSTTIANWKTPNHLSITIHDSRKSDHFSANFTVAQAMTGSVTKEFLYKGFLAVLRPDQLIDRMGLYCFTPIDPDRIPIVLVHGLASTPDLWIEPIHEIFSDPTVQKNYQFYTFFYPTGLPISHSAAGLKQEIKKLERYLKSRGASQQADQMVLIGHSMGGILSSAVTRDYRGAEKEIYKTDIHSLKKAGKAKDVSIELLEKPPLTCISRVIFIATPHRGSEYANDWIGRTTSHFIKIPKSIVEIDPYHYRKELTAVGRSIFNIQEGMDGVQRLKFNNPTLLYNLSRPVMPGVTYHSIIGDRGFPGALQDSSDGVVTYQSSHLDNTASEKIVPAWHNAQNHKQSIKEITRILKLHVCE